MTKQEIQNLIREIIEKTTVSVNEISIIEEKPNNTWFSAEVSEPHFFTGRDGEALNALNHLVRRIAESKISDEARPDLEFMIDINGYQKKRIDNIRAVAHMMAERARYFKSSIEVDPMSSFERRIVHEFLADSSDLKTESEGVGPSRRVVIKYIGGI
jgi:predicted RNA-binding protein Jag